MYLRIKRSREAKKDAAGKEVLPRIFPIIAADIVSDQEGDAAKARAVNNNKRFDRIYDIEVVDVPTGSLLEFLAIDRSIDVDAIGRTLKRQRDQLADYALTLDQLRNEIRAELTAQHKDEIIPPDPNDLTGEIIEEGESKCKSTADKQITRSQRS